MHAGRMEDGERKERVAVEELEWESEDEGQHPIPAGVGQPAQSVGRARGGRVGGTRITH